MTDKTELRRQLRAARRAHVAAIPATQRALLLRRPPTAVMDLIPAGAVVGLYHAVGSEAPAGHYARWLFEAGHQVALPRFAARDAAMAFAAWDNPFIDDLLEPDPFGAMQPCATAAAVTPAVVFVPLLGFTATGARLGQGAGHYDRWLAAHPDVVAIGLAWDCQLADHLPTEPHDVPLAAVVTPTRLFGPF